MKGLISLKDISYQFGTREILKDINLEIGPGTIHTLIGTTGSGKTLLLKLISSLLTLQKGRLDINGSSVSFVFQNQPFLSWLDLKKNLELSTSMQPEEMQTLLEKFKLESYLSLYPKNLSGGTAQKFNLLRAFLNRSDIILMDEPFSHLDMVQKEDLYKFLLDLWKDYRPTIVFVTHDIDEAIYLSHSISLLSKTSKTIEKNITLKKEDKSSLSLVEERSRADYVERFNEIYHFLLRDLR